MSDKNDGKTQTSSTSFASILAGVQRMREEAGGAAASSVTEQSQARTEPISNTPKTADTPTVNAPPVNPLASSPPTLNASSPSSSFQSGRNVLSEITAQPIPSRRESPQSSSTTSNNPSTVNRSRPAHRGFVPSEILVNKSQTGNPLLKDSMMKTQSWKFDSSILSDYYINPTLQILFLSLKYHKLRPEYIWHRLKKINKGSSVADSRSDRVLRVLLTVVDIDSHQDSLRDLLDFCIKHDLSLVLAWSFEEAGNYIVFAKQHDNAPAKTKQGIRGIRGTDYNSSLVEALTGIRLVNKTDVTNLLANCKSVRNIVQQSCQEKDNQLENIEGLGSTKIKNLKSVFLEPFIYNKEYK